MHQENIEVLISVNADADDEERYEFARRLSCDLNELNDVSVELAKGDKPPKGAMGEPLTTGAIVVAIAKAGAVTAAITGLIGILNSWLNRDERQKITLEIGGNKLELTGVSKEEQKKLVEWFQSETKFRVDI